MVDENTYAMVEHYNGQAFLSARLSLDRGETQDAEQSRRNLISSLATLEEEGEIGEYIQFLESSRWDSARGIDEAQVKSDRLIKR